MKDSVKKNRKVNKVAIVLTMVAFAVLVTSIVMAKYYSQESRKSVTTASGLYFTSNCLSKVDSVSDITAFPAYVASNGWNGSGAAVLPVHVYNYDNILLYNDKNLNITYDLYFCLLDEDDEAVYSVEYQEDGTGPVFSETLTYNTPFVIKDCYLEGGSAKGNTATLKIMPTVQIDTDTYMSGRVAVWAVPTYPDYVANTQRLAAAVQLRPVRGEFSYMAGFTIREDLITPDSDVEIENAQVLDDADRELLDKNAGFVYNIKTMGETKGVRYTFELSWRNDIYEIDQYNKYFLKAKENNLVVTNGNISTLTMDAISYSSMDICFYKTANFDSDIFNLYGDFNNTVQLNVIAHAN